jgi:hypothetical protein
MKLPFVLFVLSVILACNYSTKHSSSAFDFIPESKVHVKTMGFKEMVMRPNLPENHKTDFPKEIVLDGIFQKNVKDTIIRFIYEDDKLLRKELTFSYRHFDSLQLFHNLERRGLKKFPSTNSSFVLVDESKDQRFMVYLNRKELILSQVFAEPKAIVAPPVEEVRINNNANN